MSGLEAAGIVLGGIPLLISALEHYQEGISGIRTWRYYHRVLSSLIRSLTTENARLQNVCERLLEGLVPRSRIEEMIKKPFGEAWREGAIQGKIKSRLWRDHTVFEDTVQDMREAIEEMKQRLGLKHDGEIEWDNASFFTKEFKRVSFVFKKPYHAEQIATIEQGVTSLERLIVPNIELEPGRKLGSQGRLMKLVREISGSVYRAVRSSFQCRCAHDVHLGLEPRSAEIGPKDDDEEIIQTINFQLGLTYSPGKDMDDVEQNRSWPSREEVRIQTMRREPICNGTPNLVFTKTAPSRGYKRKSVAFSISQSSSSTTISAGQSTATMVMENAFSTLTLGSSKLGTQDCINLCKMIHHSPNESALHCYGVITDRTPQASRYFEVYPTKDGDRGAWSIVSLRQVLEQTQDFPDMLYPTMLRLAFTVSSSFLQLHQTPWLSDILTSRDVFFLRRGTDLQYEHAFVRSSLPEGSESPQSDSDSTPGNDCLALISLGILLLELNLGKTIESLRPENEKPVTGMSRLKKDSITAQALLRQKRIREPNYETAVQRCLSWGYERRGLDLNNEDFRQEIYEKIVALLETDLKNATWSYNMGT